MEENTAIEAPAIAPETVAPAATLTETEEIAARLAKLQEEKDNYKNAYLKEKGKNKSEVLDEDEDEKINRKVQEALANSRLAEIAREQDSLIQKALKENKDLKLAQLNKNTSAPAAALGTHSESRAVTDTSVTAEQLAFFKSKNWTDKDIERYKRNLAKSGGR